MKRERHRHPDERAHAGTDEHVGRLIDFARGWDRSTPMVVHCFAGISRSTGAAFVAACALNPKRDEAEIARAIRSASPTAQPNTRIVGIADRVGSLTPGKRADLILVRTNDLNVAPFVNPALLLVQQAQPYNVDTVVVDGRILKRKGELVALDTGEIIRKAAESFHAARKRAGGPY